MTEVLKEGEANELARSRAATVEGKNSIHKLLATAGSDDDTLTEEEEQIMIAKLRKKGKYSIKTTKKAVECERCVYYLKNPHSSENYVQLC